MSLRNQPTPERAFATLVVLGLAAFLGGGLLFILRQERSRITADPGAKPQLLVVLEGLMAPNVTPAETEVFRTWIREGATREGFAPVEAIVATNCASCHGPGGAQPRITGYGDLLPLTMEAETYGLFAMIGVRTLHLFLFPLAFIVASLGYLRRSAWAGLRWLLRACGLAVGVDAVQWYLRQLHPGAAWAAWASAGALAAAMLGLAAVVLSELWGPAKP
jgi:cytochrome c553